MPVNLIDYSYDGTILSGILLEHVKTHSVEKNVQVVYLEVTREGTVDKWEEVIKKCVDKHNEKNIKFIFSAIQEAPFKEHILYLLQTYENAIYIDSGKDSYHPRHITASTFFSASIQESTGFNPVPFNERDQYYACLNRQPRKTRTALVKLLVSSGLDKKGIVTLNSISKDPSHDVGLKEIKIDLIGDPNDPAVHFRQYNSLGKNALIHVVTESSYFTYNNQYWSNTDGFKYPFHWNRVFVTEKTIKAFCMHQLPLFFTVDGHVQYLRDCGFDMFDDFIDHSYDKVTDPLLKMSAVYGELHRLCNYSLEDIKQYCIKNQDRFVHNVNNRPGVYQRELDNLINKILNFIEN